VNENYVYICDSGNHRVQVIEKSGSYSHTYGYSPYGSSKNDGYLRFPSCILVYDDFIYVSDKIGVHIYSKEDGTFQQRIDCNNALGLTIIGNILYYCAWDGEVKSCT